MHQARMGSDYSLALCCTRRWIFNSTASAEMKLRREQSVPADVLRLILARVDLPNRLQNCAVVCKAWRAAAAAATTSVQASVDNLEGAARLWRWVKQHGRQSLNELAILSWTRDSGGGVYDLPFDEQLQLPQLQDLVIIGRPAFLGLAPPSDNGSIPDVRQQNPFAGMPGLTSLKLMHIEFKCSCNGLAAVSLLTHLQQLKLWCVQLPPDQLDPPNQQPALVPLDLPQQVPVHPFSFQQLTQLTSLSFEVGLCGRNAVAPFSCLQRLQVAIFIGAVSELGMLQGLPQSLEHLRLHWNGLGVLSSSTAPSLAALTGLKQLDLTSTSVETGGIHPSLLSGMQQLQELTLLGLTTDALPALLEVMPVLSKLRVLDISDGCSQLGGGVQPLPAGQMEQYSKLLPASSQLSSVKFTTSNSRMLTQEGCMQAVFNPARQLHSLRELVLDLSFPAMSDDPDLEFEDEAVLGTRELQNMASCCPNLTKLHIPGLIGLGCDKSILLHWKKSLTSLAAGGLTFTDAWTAAVMVKMTKLRSLTITDSPCVGDLGLLSLTALTKLSELRLVNCRLSPGVHTDSGGLHLVSRGDQPQVWVQVQDICRRSEECWRYINSQLAQEKAATQRYRQLLGSARAQAAAAKAKLRSVCERHRDMRNVLANPPQELQPWPGAELPMQQEPAESEVYAINWSEDDADDDDDVIDEAAKVDNDHMAAGGLAPEQQQQQQHQAGRQQ